MRTKLLIVLGMAVGIAMGSALYQLIRFGLSGVEWAKVLFIAVFTTVVLLPIPRKWIVPSRRIDSSGA